MLFDAHLRSQERIFKGINHESNGGRGRWLDTYLARDVV